MTPTNRLSAGFMAALKVGLTALGLLLVSACEQPSDTTTASNTDESGRTGFAGLGAVSDGYAHAHSGISLNFPDDHGPHPDFRIEWWYLTANLEDANGQPLGMQWTLFRQAQQPADGITSQTTVTPWATRQLWMAHMALSRGDEHRVAERFARSSGVPEQDVPQQAGVSARPFRAWLDDWQLESLVTPANQASPASDDALDRLHLSAQGEDASGAFGYALTLEANGPLVRHGEAGFSQKSADGQGSMYYSQPFYRVSGEVMLDGEQVSVSGRAWLDREWSSQLLSADQAGWDWFSLHLDSGDRLMAFRLRGGGENSAGYLSGSWITAAGKVTPLHDTGLSLTPLESMQVNGHQVPVRWQLTLPEKHLGLEITARNTNRWMDTSVPYWEGAVSVSDAANGDPRGEGYLEMTGY